MTNSYAGLTFLEEDALPRLAQRQGRLKNDWTSTASLNMTDARDRAWLLYSDVFEGWSHAEADLETAGCSPAELVEIRESFRERAEFGLFRYTNFPDASRLIKKLFAREELLEFADEKNPGAPPSLNAVYERLPQARGPVPEADRSFVEILDHAALRLHDLDVVHDRTRTAVELLVPRVLATLATGDIFCLLDVACGGNQLSYHLRTALLKLDQFSAVDLCRIHVFGVDLDKRAPAYTFARHGFGWNAAEDDIEIALHTGNIATAETSVAIRKWLAARARTGFDAVVALGILDYFDCPVPGAEKVYIPEAFATVFGHSLRAFLRSPGILVAVVFAAEHIDHVSRGGRHLFANWHLKYASKSLMQKRFPFLVDADFIPMLHADGSRNYSAHFMAHPV